MGSEKIHFRELSEALDLDLDTVVESLIEMDKRNLDLVAEDKAIDKEYMLKVRFLPGFSIVVSKHT